MREEIDRCLRFVYGFGFVDRPRDVTRIALPPPDPQDERGAGHRGEDERIGADREQRVEHDAQRAGPRPRRRLNEWPIDRRRLAGLRDSLASIRANEPEREQARKDQRRAVHRWYDPFADRVQVAGGHPREDAPGGVRP